ncbi:probable myosin-binding protein 6 [Andrographis paniculata]|uniref:probable myosin-binding protein 6 n=1 Tax=Andrographis paniculata TaxID=175694 RepID=UPI0021E8DDC6|nr:probable myosin-binding protein 6 [Andrographis paniculata]
MAEDNMVMSESDISALKETLCAQQQLLQKLYNELDAERESSATAASEALSLILRLQGEKAAIKLEAEQYKRLSEEKIWHAEESLAIIEDIIYSKEMEVAALDHQVQAYRCKLLSIGCLDEIKASEVPLQRCENLVEEISHQSLGRRNSATVALKHMKVSSDKDADADFVLRSVEEPTVQEETSDMDSKVTNSSAVDINSYMEQIRRLGERVREIAGANSWSETRSLSSASSQSNNVGNRTRSPSPFDSNPLSTVNETEKPNVAAGDHPSSPSIHDVFEVPRVVERNEHKLGIRDVIHPEAVEVHCPKETFEIPRKKPLRSSAQRKKKLRRHEIGSVADGCFSAPRQQLSNRTSEIIEVEGPSENNNNREEQVKLLNEIKEEINCLRDEVRSWRVKKKSPARECPSSSSSLSSLQEAMIYFWI